MPTNKFLTKTKILGQIGLVVLLMLAFIFLSNVQESSNRFYTSVKWIFPYITLLILLSFFSKYKYIRIAQTTLGFPLALLLAIGPHLKSLSGIIIAFIITLAFSMILCVIIPAQITQIDIQEPAVLFILLTSTSIIMTTFGNIILRQLHATLDTENKEQQYELSLKILDEKKTRIIIFAVYFVLLVVFNIGALNDKPLLDSERLTTAILQSFVTFIAYDRLLTSWSSLNANSKNKTYPTPKH